MANDRRPGMPMDGALQPMPPGELVRIGSGSLAVDIAPAAGGRIAQITHDGVAWLVGHGAGNEAMIAWGCYPMLPWVGRLRRGRFRFRERDYRLPANLDGHAIHGVGFGMPWQVERRAPAFVELSLQLPEDERWPFGGSARQRIEVEPGRLRACLSVTAGAQAMPVAIGWHAWFRKPDGIGFSPRMAYQRDEEGIATLPLVPPMPGPWDDCFINDTPAFVHRAGQHLRLTSDCRHWVVFDKSEHSTCFEPQSGPPDAFNLEPVCLAPGESRAAWFLMEWQ